jgi:PII-like signaling protein
MLSIVNAQEQIEKLLPHLDKMVNEGLGAMARVEVMRYTRSPETTIAREG